MKILIAKRDLEVALKIVSPSMAKTGTDLSTHYVFRPHPSDKGRMEVLTYTNRVFTSCPFVAQIEGDGMFTIEGKRLNTWLESLPEVPVEWEVAKGTITATVPSMCKKRPQKFQSLDPKGFPFWDITLQEAKTTITMSPERLSAALDYSQGFASSQFNKMPEVCVCEVIKGELFSTDKEKATILKVKGLENCTLRLFVPDMGIFQTFLSNVVGDIEVLEHDRGIYFRRGDGANLGTSRFGSKFPPFRRPNEVDQHYWVLNVGDLKSGILYLTSGADWQDNRLLFTRPDPNGPVQMSMINLTGATVSVDIECSESGSAENVDPFPSVGFFLSHLSLSQVLKHHDGDTIKIGVNVRKGGGYIRKVDTKFADETGKNGDDYLTLVSWLK